MFNPDQCQQVNLIRFTTAKEVIDNYNFFESGMVALNDPKGAKSNYTSESFFLMLMRVINAGDLGLVLLLTSKRNKPLGFGVAMASSDVEGVKCLYILEFFSNGKFKDTRQVLLQAAEQHARSLGLNKLRASTRRINGCGFRLFEGVWGFKREFVTFTRDVI